MAKTRQITVNSTSPTAITVQSSPGCSSVRVVENPGVTGWPTTDLLIFKPDQLDTSVRWPAGMNYEFTQPGLYQVNGARVGWVQTVTGSTTLDVDES